MHNLESWARAYHQRGLAVIPLRPRAKVPAIARWQERRLGLDELLSCLRGDGAGGLGLVAGHLSGNIVVLDFDGLGWLAGFEHWNHCWPELADAPVVQTGSGKCHVWLRCPDLPRDFTRQEFKRPDLQAAIELRGNACNCVVPPSLHPSGGRYQWVNPEWTEPPEVSFANLQGWLAEWAGQTGRPGAQAGIVPSPIPEGQRNSTLTSLAGTMRRRGAEEAEILAALHRVNELRCRPPLPDAEVETIAASVARYPPEPAATLRLPPKHRTDLGNARRLVARHGRELLYCDAWGKWLVWDGQRWTVDPTLEVERRAVETVTHIYAEARNAQDSERRKELARWAIRSEAAPRIQAMIRLARSQRPATADGFDQDRWLLNVANGTLDLRIPELRPHDPADRITRLAPVTFDPQAQCPLWEAFLERILDGNANLIQFLQCAAGYALTADTSEQAFFILYGTGSNGKTTFLETIAALMGDYAQATAAETLLVKRWGGISNDLAKLRGARLVTAAEVGEGRRLAEGLVKQLTGGDTITARFLYRDFFDFRPVFKLFLASNHKPRIRGTDHAIWRRIKLIPFTVTIPEGEQDKHLAEKLRGELPGILNWALLGCLAWRHSGLGEPEEVRSATAAYRAEMDVLAAFLADCCELGEDKQARAAALYLVYKDWCDDNGEKALSGTTFGRQLRERGFAKHHDRHGSVYAGLSLAGKE